MKIKATLLLIIFISSFKSTAQIIKIERSKFPSYSTICNSKLDYYSSLVIPLWRKPKNDIWDIYGAPWIYSAVKPKDFKKWQKRVIKDDDYVKKSVLDTTAFVYSPSKFKAKYDEYENGTNLEEFDSLLLNYDADIDMLLANKMLSNHAAYQYSINISQQLDGDFNLKAIKALTYRVQNNLGLLNGMNSIKFYNDSSPNPIGCFIGEMKNGKAHGYGILVKPYYYDNKLAFKDVLNDNRVLFYARMGYWKDGEFEWEKNANEDIDKIVDKFKNDINLQVSDNSEINKDLIYAVYQKDRLAPNLPNSHVLKYNLIWKSKADITQKNRNIYLRQAFVDFDDHSPSPVYINADNLTIEDFSKKNGNGQSASDKLIDNYFNRLQAYESSYENVTILDDYTKIETTPWYVKTWEICEYSVTYDENTDKEISRVPSVFKETYARNIKVYTRKQKKSDWELINQTSINRINTCSSVYETTNIDPYWSFPEQIVSNYEEGLATIIQNVKYRYPNPTIDNSVSEFNATVNSKFEKILQRVSMSTKYKPDNEDLLIGAWYDVAKGRIYLIENASDGANILCIKKDNSNLRSELGYYAGINSFEIERLDNNKFVLLEDLEIMKSDSNSIIFKDGTKWERINKN